MATHATDPGVIHWAARYDLLLAFLTLGREGALRERILDLAQLVPGEAVLDVGCGTGTLAIAAKRRVGEAAAVRGVDASPEMIARATKKAARRRVDVAFEVARAESLPLPGASMSVVLSTVMLHHLRRAARQECLGEARRVLVPGGRLLVVDFGGIRGGGRGFLAHFHRHGGIDLRDLVAEVAGAGFDVVTSGAVGTGTLQYVLGKTS